jgi:hypothetical protein
MSTWPPAKRMGSKAGLSGWSSTSAAPPPQVAEPPSPSERLSSSEKSARTARLAGSCLLVLMSSAPHSDWIRSCLRPLAPRRWPGSCLCWGPGAAFRARLKTSPHPPSHWEPTQASFLHCVPDHK